MLPPVIEDTVNNVMTKIQALKWFSTGFEVNVPCGVKRCLEF
jgi:hypothetical protein